MRSLLALVAAVPVAILIGMACSPSSSPGPAADASVTEAAVPASDAASPQPDASPDASSLINSCGAYYEINPDGIPPKDRAFCLENTTNHQAGNCCISDKQCSDLGLKCCPWGTDCTGPDTSCECYQP